MSAAHRVSLLAGAVAALLLVLIIFQGAMQQVETQTVDQANDAAGSASFPPTNGSGFAEDQIIVELEEGATQSDLAALNQRNDARTEENLPRSDVNVVALPSDLTVGEAVRRYEASPDVEYAEPDFVLQPAQTSPSDPSYPRLYGLNNTGQTGGAPDADIDAKEAWGTTSGSLTTVVAVIDEGVDTNHPDLRNNIWVNTDEVPGNGVDDDRNGYVDDVNGYDFAHDDASVYDPADGDDHGTHVAGTIAGQGNNSTGVTGVNWRASIMVLKFMGSNGGYTSDAVEALNYAVANGARISSNSWGGGGSLSLQSAISRADTAGHLFVVAAGNNGRNNDTTPQYPCSYNNPNILCVAATDDRDSLASFSNFGATTVDLAAPGVNILSTLPGNSYGSYNGTSMATPHVTGVAALIKSNSPTLDDAQIKGKILQSVDKKANLQGTSVTGGRLNAPGALGVRGAELGFVVNPLTVKFGGATFLSGRLTSSGEPLSGKQVILEQRPVGASAFSQLANGVRTTDADGNFSLAGVVPTTNTDYRARFAGEASAGLPAATSLERRVNVELRGAELGFVVNPLTVKFGGATFLSGRLTSSGEPLSGKQVILEQRPVGASAFSQLANGVRTTDADGNFSLAGVVPTTNTDYRARFAGEASAGLPAATSLERRVNAAVAVSLSTATATLELGQSQTISGSVSPAHTGSVKLIIDRNRRRLTTRTVPLTGTGYSFIYTPARTGTYAVAASFGSDTDHLGGASVKIIFKVVK